MATVNKVALANGTVLIDLTSDTVTAGSVLAGVTAHDKSGAKITGTLFSNFQDIMELTDSITDSSGNADLQRCEHYGKFVNYSVDDDLRNFTDQRSNNSRNLHSNF